MKTALSLFACAACAAFAQTPAPKLSEPVLVYKAEPEYSPEARAAKLQGVVYVYLEVDEDGKPDKVQLMHGLGLGLDQKAIDAVSQWRYQPGSEDGSPIRMALTAEVDFHLPGDGGPWRVRQASYAVDRDHQKVTEVLAKPVLSQYAAPAAACPAEGATAMVELSIGEDGRPGGVRTHEQDPPYQAAARAVGSWRFLPAMADGKPRSSTASIELECGSPEAAPNPSGFPSANPVPTRRTGSQYSEQARLEKFEGAVTVTVVIDTTGHATNLRILQMVGHGLDEKAMESVSYWRFKPGTKDGRPISFQVQIEVNFRLL